jgi:hypothetical protein
LGDNYAERLPQEIVQILAEKRDPLFALAREIRTWLMAIGYQMSDPHKIDSRTLDMIATFDKGTISQKLLIHCIDGIIRSDDADLIDNRLDRKTPKGWLISDTRVSSSVRDKLNGNDSLRVFTFSDFLKQMIWGPYIESLESLVKKSRIPELYVDLACYTQEIREGDVLISKTIKRNTFLIKKLMEKNQTKG